MNTLVSIVALTLSLAAAALRVEAAYPEKPIEAVIPWPAAQEIDILSRTVTVGMSKRLGVPVQVINKPGGQGVIGMADVVRAKPDGYTITFTNIGPLLSQSIAGNATYKPADFEPIGLFSASTFVLAARADAPFKTIKEMEAHAKSSQKPLIVGNFGPGALPTLTVFRMSKQNGWSFKPVTFSPPGALQLDSGDADLVTAPYTTVASAIKAGKVRALVVFTKDRLAALPEVPTLREAGYAFDVLIWSGAFAPKGTPREVTEKVAAALRDSLKDPAVIELAGRLNVPLYFMDAIQTAAQIKEDEAALRPIMDSLGLIKK